MASVAENISFIKERIDIACTRVGRDPAGVNLVGVTKTVPIERIRDGVKAGLRILGENYIQEARMKVDALADLDVSWHFIGHLQSNKAKIAAELCDCIHTVDRESLARELERQAERLGREIPVLIQVNIAGEVSKSGIEPERLSALYESIQSFDRLVVRGLMTMPPYLEDPEEVRPFFRKLRELLDRLKEESPKPEELNQLSMGMSHDFEVAIEEGATFIRVGTAIFGERF